jgi:anti-sigma B factor antagonist
VSDANSTEARTGTQTGGTPSGPGRPAEPPSARRREPGGVHVLTTDDHVRVVLAGDVDAALAPELLEAAAEVVASGLPVQVDTRNVTFMDSSGVAFLARLAGGSATRPVVLDPPDHVQFLLEITAIGRMLELRTDGGTGGRSPDDAA